VADFFTQNLVSVFFIYGLAFFCMGLAINLEVGHSSEMYFAHALRPLSWFGFIHGSHEWFEMFLIMRGGEGEIFGPGVISSLRVFLLATSFCMLLAFGVWLVAASLNTRQKLGILAAAMGIYIIGLVSLLTRHSVSSATLVQADVYTRYSLAIPGAVLSAWGLILQQKRFANAKLHLFRKDLIVAAAAFALYGGVGQLFAAPTPFFPSNQLNTEVFLRLAGFPIQVFRAAMATIAAIAIVRSMRAFEVENTQRIQALQSAQLAERQKLEALREELFQRTVRAQETERQRIARELHDGVGQTLTALGLGLRALVDSIEVDPSRATKQARQLQVVATDGVDELRQMVAGLHPPQLDDLGLLPAIRSLSREVSEVSGLTVNVLNGMHGQEISPESRVVLFRIVQEALTNVVRHAFASEVYIRLDCAGDHIQVEIRDNGQGFDPNLINMDVRRPNLGLLGMTERAALIGGTCQIHSKPGGGTTVLVKAPLQIEEAGHA